MKIKPGVGLVSVVVCLWINLAAGQNGEFEGSALTSLKGKDRLVDFDTDTDTATALTIETNYCPRVNLPGVGINLKGEEYDRIYICANGMLRFKDGTYQNWPRNFGITGQIRQRSDPCLAPYWSNVDRDSLISGDSKVYFKQYTNKDNDVFTIAADYAKQVLKKDFSPEWVLVVTWKDLRPAEPGSFGGRNTFQCLITSDNTASIAVYIYADIDWSVRAVKTRQASFKDNYPPVAGWNAGERNGRYRDKKEYNNFKHSGSVLIEEIDDEQGNLNPQPRGKFGFELGGGTEIEPSPVAKCITWSLNERRLSCIHRCPPSINYISRFSYDFRFRVYFENRGSSICFISGYATRSYPTATRCCYRRNFRGNLIRRGSNSGSVLRYHPFLFPNQHAEEKEAYENCCKKTLFCGFYFRVRPRCITGWRSPVLGFLYGDPHFRTLDGKNYTFNGCGWYTYFKGNIPNVDNSSLVIQVRTTRVGDANATAFTGIVLKEGVSETVQVNLRSTGGFIVLIDGSEYTEALTETGETFPGGATLNIVDNITLSISTPLGNGVRITDTANGTFFTFVTTFIEDYKNSSSGLSGKWNDNIDDDFTLPDGQTLSIDLSDSDIHYQFGEKWTVENNETLYTNVSDDVNFQCPATFVPIFLDEALQFTNSTLKQEAERICGNDVNCLFDIAVTGNTAIGESTISQVRAVDKEIAELENNFPYFSENITTLNVTVGETFYLELTAVDPDGDTLSFDVDGLPSTANYTSSGNVLSFSWFVTSVDQVNLTFAVEDTKNGTVSFSPDINVCACQNGASCFIPGATSDVTKQIIRDFVVMECKCPLGKIGRYCQTQKDFCESSSGTVCHPLVTCANNPTNFTCGPCPTGFTGNGHVCTDIDECNAVNNGGCDQLCANAAPLFNCDCNRGYTLNSDKTTCNDIDECSRANDCSQLCNNTEGSFQCYCRIGFEIDPDKPNNCKATNLCEAGNDCEQICYMDPLNPGEAKCECNGGYILDDDQKKCRDVDECVTTETNLCDQVCTNTIASYNCSCKNGFEPNGQYSCKDIDECITGDFTCDGSGEICDNFIGGHRCICNEQWNLLRVNGSCVLDPNAVADPPPEPRRPTTNERGNSVRLKILDFQKGNWTIKEDDLFRSSVITLINDFCNENNLRPQDCGVSQNQLLFNLLHVQRIPGFPQNNGSDAIIEFYVVYPNNTTPGPVPRSILASIINAQLEKLKSNTKLDLILETSVTPKAPKEPTTDEAANFVTVQIINFKTNQWTTFYDDVFRRAVAIVLNEYCNRDVYSLENDCQLVSGSPAAFNLTHIGRLPGFPATASNGGNVDVSFYVNYPNGTAIPVPRIVLASILTTQRNVLQSSLTQLVTVVTYAAPGAPPIASDGQKTNSVVLQISDFQANYWTYLNDRRLRKSIASRLASYCGKSRTTLTDCQITGNQASFTILDVERKTSGTLPSSGNNADFSFYVKYPGGSRPVAQSILAAVIKTELNALQLESGFTLTLQTSFQPPPPSPPSNAQSNNLVEIEILNLQADQWTAIQDNRLRAAIAAQLTNYCTNNLLACDAAGNQVFTSSHVTRISAYPSQNGNNATYRFFVDIRNGNGPLPKNLLAGILLDRLTAIQTASDSQFSVETLNIASPPRAPDSSETVEAVTVRISNLQADQWSAIQDNVFRGSVAKASTDYCQLNAARRQECGDTQTTFTLSNVQRIPNSPSQNETSSDLTFYVVYSNGNPVRKRLLALIIQEQLDSLQSSTGLQLSLQTTFPPPPVDPPPTVAQNRSSIEVVITDYDVSKWPILDPTFRQKMAEQLIQFCNTSTAYFNLCNISRNDLFSLNSSHVQLLPGSPTQSGNNAVLAFYVNLPSGTGTVARNILATVFVSRQDQIFSLEATAETSSLPEEQIITPQQQQNLVPIAIFDYSVDKFTSLEVLDIKITVAARMNNFCFRVGSSENACSQSQRRRRRDTTNENIFTQDDVQVIQNSVKAEQNNTVLNISVTYPGQNIPVSSNIVQDALRKSFQQDTTSDITNLKLGIVNIHTVTSSQNASAIEVLLPNFSVNQWLSKDTSFRRNMTNAIVAFCNESVYHLELCNISRDKLSKFSFLNVQTLPNSPSQNGNDALLSFYVNLPSGSGIMPRHVLATIFALKKDDILSQPFSLQTSQLSPESTSPPPQQELVEVTIENTPELNSLHLLDIQHTVADAMNQYCNSSTNPCNGTFTSKDVHVFVLNGTVQFYVTYPGTDTLVSRTIAEDAVRTISTSKILGLMLTVSPTPTPTTTTITKDNGVDWPLILGLSIGGALLLIFVVLSIIIGVLRGDKMDFKSRRDYYDHDARSVYTPRGWEFDRASPYSGSPFASIDAIPGFDEDGLPSENPIRDTHIN